MRAAQARVWVELAEVTAPWCSCTGVLLLLGAFTFWVMDHGTQEATFNERIEPKKMLKPLATAPTRPKGGGMVEMQPEPPSNGTSAPLGNSTPVEPAATAPQPPAATTSSPNNTTQATAPTINGTQS